MKYAIVIDFGTGGVHINIVSTEGNFISSSYLEIEYHSDGFPMGLKFDADNLFNKTLNLVEKTVYQSKIDRKDIISIAVTSQRSGVIFLDSDKKTICACPNIDNRANQEAIEISKIYGQEIYEITGRWPLGIFPALRLLWFKKNRPEVFLKIDKILMINDWLAFKLAGVECSEWTNATETLLFDIKKLTWSKELIKIFDLESLKLSRIVKPGTAIGTLETILAKRLNLCQNIVVVLAAADTQSALIGTGALRNGDVTIVNGSTTPVQMVVENAISDKKNRIWTGPYIPGKWVLESNCGKSGMVYRKLVKDLSEFVQLFAPNIDIDYKELREIVIRCKDETKGVQTFLGPGIMDASNFQNLKNYILLANEDVNLFKAIIPSFIENLAFATAANVEQLEKISGIQSRRICITGGASKDKLLMKIIPQLFKNRKITLSTYRESTSLGAAMQAFVANKIFPDLNRAKNAIRNLQKDVTFYKYKNKKDKDLYLNKYENWKKRYKNLIEYENLEGE